MVHVTEHTPDSSRPVTRLFSRMEGGMKAVAAACLLGMAVVTGMDVVGRAAMDMPLYGSEEIASILAVLVVGLSLPYAHSQGSQIGVEVVYQRLGRRARRILSFSTHLVSAVLFGVVAWQMWTYGLDRQQVGQVSLNLALPTYYVLYVLAGCFAVFTLFLFRDALRALGRNR